MGPTDKIVVDGKALPAAEPPRLWRYHKPRGLVTTHKDPEGRPTVFDALPKTMPRVISIGRLDFNTEGLLLLTNDGALARHLELPSTGWLRRYRVRAHGSITQEALDKLKDGIEIKGIRYGPIEAVLEKPQGSNVWLRIGLREGKNREVRTILETLGLAVNRLIRTSYGPFQLLDMEPGTVEPVKARVLREHLGAKPAAELGVARRRGGAQPRIRQASRAQAARAGHEDRRRQVPRPRRWRRRRTRARAPPPTACARRCSTSSRTASTISPSTASRCSTCSPAPARWAWRRCRAAPPSACSSRRTPRRAA